LIEHGFYTNLDEFEKLKNSNFRQSLAEADAKGILQYFGIEYKEEDQEESKVKNLIIYYGEADLHYAKILKDFIGGFIVSEDDYKVEPIKADTYYKIGGTWKPEGNVIMLAGVDKKRTAISVLEYVSKL
jgi:hypothetical protein